MRPVSGEHVVTPRRWTIRSAGYSQEIDGPETGLEEVSVIEAAAVWELFKELRGVVVAYDELERRYKALEQASRDVVTRFRYPDVDGRIEDKGTAIGDLRRLLDSLSEGPA